MTLARITLALTFLSASACGPILDEGQGSSTTGDVSTGDESTSEASSTGDASSSTGGDASCFGEQCDGTCAPDLVCSPHPSNASLAVCAAPCNAVGQVCTLQAAGCEAAPLGLCREGFTGTVLCYPLLCDNSGACLVGSCVGGRCY